MTTLTKVESFNFNNCLLLTKELKAQGWVGLNESSPVFGKVEVIESENLFHTDAIQNFGYNFTQSDYEMIQDFTGYVVELPQNWFAKHSFADFKADVKAYRLTIGGQNIAEKVNYSNFSAFFIPLRGLDIETVKLLCVKYDLFISNR